MSVQDKAVETLSGLGLTVLQAKVYLTLLKEGKSTIKDIARVSKVARQDLYRITPQLLNLGLIEKIIDTPIKFRAIPLQTASDMLIERRKKQTAKLEQESKEILRYYAAKEDPNSKDDEAQFVIINDLQARLNRASKQISNTKSNLSIVTKWAFFVTYTLETFDEHLKALNRGVHIQIVSQVPNITETFPKKLRKLLDHPLFELRFTSSLPSSIVAIFDRQEVNILLASNKSPKETGLLMSNSINLVELSNNYFEMTWFHAVQVTNQNFSAFRVCTLPRAFVLPKNSVAESSSSSLNEKSAQTPELKENAVSR